MVVRSLFEVYHFTELRMLFGGRVYYDNHFLSYQIHGPANANNMSHTIRIIRCRDKDLAAVQALDETCFSDNALPVFVLRQFHDLFTGLVLVAKRGQQIIGYAAGGVSTNREGWVLSLAVHPCARSEGIGKRLLGRLLKKFMHEDVKKVWLTVRPDNKAALRVFSSVGFERVRTVEEYFGKNEPRLVMVMRFNNDK